MKVWILMAWIIMIMSEWFDCYWSFTRCVMQYELYTEQITENKPHWITSPYFYGICSILTKTKKVRKESAIMLYYYSGKSESHSVYLSVKSTCIFNIYLHVCMYVCMYVLYTVFHKIISIDKYQIQYSAFLKCLESAFFFYATCNLKSF